MKPDCNVNTKELGIIVRNMLDEKNKTGRQAFEIMQPQGIEEDHGSNPIELIQSIIEGRSPNDLIITTIDSQELIVDEIWYDRKNHALRISVGKNG